ncbi:hypothetical protein GF345_06380 [Candidatus Woesearchaeota archaeon]|nr:hypothetical protein [Candidatus Woesearchaeota archaeon]
MYCGKGGCGPAYHRPKPLFKPEYVSPDKAAPMYAKAHDIRKMYQKVTGMEMDQAGGSYQRKVGPDLLAGYTNGTANSGNYQATIDYSSQVAAARQKHDFTRLFG